MIFRLTFYTILLSITELSRTTLKATRKITLMIVDRVFLSEITWTGKSKPGTPQKIAMEDYNRIVALIFAVVRRSHPSYQKATFRSDLVDRILKTTYM